VEIGDGGGTAENCIFVGSDSDDFPIGIRYEGDGSNGDKVEVKNCQFYECGLVWLFLTIITLPIQT